MQRCLSETITLCNNRLQNAIPNMQQLQSAVIYCDNTIYELT